MTQHAYDVVERFRDLGGQADLPLREQLLLEGREAGQALRRIRQWRDLSRPEAAPVRCPVQGERRRDAAGAVLRAGHAVAPWLFEGTGIENGDTLGDEVGGFGIEIDTTTPLSPPGTKVLAVIPNLFGPGLHAEMAYYETPAGARVFSAGVLDFPAVLLHPAGMRLMDNLWRHMLARPEDEAEAEPKPDA